MNTLFFGIPLLAFALALVLYSANGRRQILRFDLVQFFYAFIISPTLFLWSKSFLHVLLNNEIKSLSSRQIFFYDSAFSLLFLYVYAFVVIHSLTKTFELNKKKNPSYDFFADSEALHLDISHLIIYLGALVLSLFLSLSNLIFPLDIDFSIQNTWLIFIGIILGYLGYLGLWSYKGKSILYSRLIKLGFAAAFLLQVLVYFLANPVLSIEYSLFWIIFVGIANMVTLLLFAEEPQIKDPSLWKRFLVRFRFKKKSQYYLRRLTHLLTRKVV